jgi:hypothetical protein
MEEDAIAEGISRPVSPPCNAPALKACEALALLWDLLNEQRGYGWVANPWVFVISFKYLKTLKVFRGE